MKKTMFICVGLPGSGKSTLSQQLINDAKTLKCSYSYHSTDSYFMVDGKYQFDSSKLGFYHNCNRCAAEKNAETGIEVIIIDNTNLTSKERKPYIEIAKQYGYDVNVIEPDTDWKFNVEELTRRNTHNVPLEAIQRMLNRYTPFSQEELG